MNYKETLFFIGKCLTISHDSQKLTIVEKQIKDNNVNWDNVVKVATAHYVFPALYCNLKRKNLTQYLPKELVTYMIHITDLNRERNLQIIEQAKEINNLLLTNNISPIFLKGTGNLLEGLYADIGERMIGDIDILIQKSDCKKAYMLLIDYGYFNEIALQEDHRHLSRLIHKSNIGAIEIHKEMLRGNNAKYFNYQHVENTMIDNNNIKTLSNGNKIKLTIYSRLINDYEYRLKKINLRAAYDYYLISNKSTHQIKLVEPTLKKELDAGLEIYNYILAKPRNINFSSTIKSKRFLNVCLNKLNRSNTAIFKTFFNKMIVSNSIRIEILFKSLYKRDYFKFVIKKITNKNWIKSKLGLKPNS
jgi:hypothetical protein